MTEENTPESSPLGQVGEYLLLEKIAEGGMGAVYLAKNETTDRKVALKILPREMVADGVDSVERFQLEIATLAQLTHSNIVNILGRGETEEGDPWYAMEFIEGDTLEARIRGGGLSTDHVYQWIPQICDALEFAHQHGIVHRDIKPANILISYTGQVKIVDFGLAKHMDADQTAAFLKTQVGVSLGTPDFVSPEQMDGTVPVDGRADIYSLSVLLYNLLTNDLPKGSWKMPSIAILGLPVEFDHIVDKGMEKSPEARWESAADFKEALLAVPRQAEQRSKTEAKQHTKPVLVTEPVSVKAGSGPVSDSAKRITEAAATAELERKKRSKSTLIAVSVLAVLALAVGGWLFSQGDESGGKTGQNEEVPLAAMTTGEDKNSSVVATEPVAPVESESAPADAKESGTAEETVEESPEVVAAVSLPANEPVDPEPVEEEIPEKKTVAAPVVDVAARLREIEEKMAAPAVAVAAAPGTESARKLKRLRNQYLQALATQLKKTNLPADARKAIKAEGRFVRDGGVLPEKDPDGIHPGIREMRVTFRKSKADLLAKGETGGGAGSAVDPEVKKARQHRKALHDLMRDLVVADQLESTAVVAGLLEPVEKRFFDLVAEREKRELAKEGTSITEESSEVETLPPVTFPLTLPFPPQRKKRVGIPVAIDLAGDKLFLLENKIGPERVVDVAAYYLDQIFLREDGTVFGSGGGELIRQLPPDLKDIVAIRAVYPSFGGALSSSGKLTLWGGVNGQEDDVIAETPDYSDIVDFEMRHEVVAVIREGGYVEAWGKRQALVDSLDRLNKVVQLQFNNAFGLALKESGRVEVFYDSGERLPESEKRALENLENVVQIFLGEFQSTPETLALTADGKIHPFGWGAKALEIPDSLPTDIDRIGLCMKDGNAGIAAHSHSVGWKFFGNFPFSLSEEKLADLKEAWAFDFAGSNRWIALLPPVEEEIDPDTRTMKPEVPKNLSYHYASPSGEGATFTLDEALENAKNRDTIVLAPGEYPQSAKQHDTNFAGAGDYAILQSNLTLLGHRSVFSTDFRIPGFGVSLSGIKCRNLELRESTDCSIENVICTGYLSATKSGFSAKNVLVYLKCEFYEKPERLFQNVTVLHQRGRTALNPGEREFTDCLFVGGDAFLLYSDKAGKKATLTNCIVAPTASAAQIAGAVVGKPADLADHGFELKDCVYDKPVFMDPEKGDYRLAEGSAGKGAGTNGRDIGVHLDEDGWPVSRK